MNYIKHWQLSRRTVLAFRAFGGVAIPFGNANSIPFTRSYFSGGSTITGVGEPTNWGLEAVVTSMNLMKLISNLHLIWSIDSPLIAKMNGAFFVDAGNIWNVLDNVTDPEYRFDGFEDLSEIAIGTGFGLRYDFDFFVFRLDTGFKTYNPSLPKTSRWEADYAISNAVFNIGINYPF